MAVSKEQALAELKRRNVKIPEPNSWATENVARPILRGFKSAAKAVGGLGDLANLPINTALQIGGYEPLGSPSQDIENIAEYYSGGLTTPRNNTERIVDAAGEFIASGANPYALSKKVPQLAKLAPQNVKELFSFGTAGAGAEIAHQKAPDSWWAPLLGGAIGAVVPGGITSVGKTATHLGESLQNNIAKGLKIDPAKVATFQEAGVTPTLADVSGRKAVATAQNTFKQTPFVGHAIENSINKTQEKLGSFFRRNGIDNPMTQAEAGEVAQSGLRNLQKEGFEKASELSTKMARHVQNDTAIPIKNALSVIKSIPELSTPEARRSFNQSTIGKKYTELENIAARNGGTVPYADLIQLRNDITDSITTFGKVGAKEQGSLKHLYGKVQQDLGEYFKTLSPQAKLDFENHNKFYSALAKKNEEVVNKLLHKKTATQTFKDIVNNQRIDGRKTKAVLESLSPDERKVFSSALIREIGSTAENDFSPALLARKFNQLEPEVQQTMLSSYPKETQNQFRHILQAVDHITETGTAGNASRATYGITSAGLGVAASQAPLSTIATVAAGKIISSKLFTNPDFINWLAKAESVQGTKASAEHIAKLGAIAKSTPALASDISSYINTMKGLGQKQSEQIESKRPTKEQAREMLTKDGIDWRTGQKLEKPQSDNNQNLLKKMAYVESGNNPNARSNTSSASGLLQFTDGTWRDAVKRYGQETGISLRDKNNPKAQRMLTQLMLRDNGQELQTFLGRKPNDTELYLTHFLGLGGTKKLLRSRGSNQSAARLLPAAAKANRSIFFKGRRPRSVDEVYQVISQKI